MKSLKKDTVKGKRTEILENACPVCKIGPFDEYTEKKYKCRHITLLVIPNLMVFWKDHLKNTKFSFLQPFFSYKTSIVAWILSTDF